MVGIIYRQASNYTNNTIVVLNFFPPFENKSNRELKHIISMVIFG